MNPTSPAVPSRISLAILTVTSLVSSRAFFAFLDDPEGPNLLIVVVTAAILFSLSLAAYRFSRVAESRRLPLAIIIQVVVTALLYLLGR